ncbi:hypothetical protein ABZ864_45260 [Streptomyces sp. NPDC047082]|uniref:hypothetical protein n=1 Tax=Streptomyces sp. NPDC047082 TaxID=3155259 RepID=UPI0033D8FBF2
MSDQNAATSLTAAAVIALILIARATVLHHSRDRAARTAYPRPHHTKPNADTTPTLAAAPPDDVALCAVREAEQYVHRCWQQFQAHTDPPE